MPETLWYFGGNWQPTSFFVTKCSWPIQNPAADFLMGLRFARTSQAAKTSQQHQRQEQQTSASLIVNPSHLGVSQRAAPELQNHTGSLRLRFHLRAKVQDRPFGMTQSLVCTTCARHPGYDIDGSDRQPWRFITPPGS